MELNISMELAGKSCHVGSIIGTDSRDARFTYAPEYLNAPDRIAISGSLPLRAAAFSPEQTRCFFDGLLPEGFTRRTIAQWVRADERDYLKILAELGKECLGALKITMADAPEEIPCCYERLSLEQVRELAREGAEKSAELVTKAHLSLTGASGKVGLYYHQQEQCWYLPKGSAPSTHIVKQSHIRLDSIVPNEQLSMLTAKKLGIDTPNSFIINTGAGRDPDILFATERYDRIWSTDSAAAGDLPMPLRLHQEDFCQLLGITSSEKYEQPGQHYMRDMFDAIRRYSSDPIADQIKLWDRIVFNFLLGNTDAHLKNFSLLHGQNPRVVRLAPAYDLVSTAVYDRCTRDMAFRIGGKLSLDEIDRSSFANAAKEVGLGPRIAMQHFDRMADGFEAALTEAAEALRNEGFETAQAIQKQILRKGGFQKL